MKKLSALIVSLLIFSMLFGSVSAATLPPGPQGMEGRGSLEVNKFQAAEVEQLDFASETGRYIVTFEQPPVAASQVWQGKIDPQAEQTERSHAYQNELDAAAARLEAYQRDKVQEMRSYLNKGELNAFYHYTYVLNGVSVALSSQEALRVMRMPGVKAVYPVTLEQPLTDAGPQWVGAGGIWDDTMAPDNLGTKGEGVLVGILDTGINFDHPSFSDQPADGFQYFWPGSYKGVCNAYDPQAAANPGYTAMCNNKLVGAFSYTKETLSPEDADGHGTHTASTVAGNAVEVEVKGVTTTMSGVAPHAQVIAFDVCDATGCWGDASVKAVNDALREGVDALNYSISGGKSPYGDAVEQAFLEATAAGVFVAASGGNLRTEPTVDGNVNHVSPWVMTVAASSHNRKFSPAFSVTSPAGSPWANMVLIPSSSPQPWVPTPDIEIVWGGDYQLSATTDNRDGCAAFPAAFFAGKVAALNRGVCSFAIKVTNAVNAGAVGVIGLADNRPPISWGGLDEDSATAILSPIPVGTLYYTVDETRAFEAFLTANKPVRMSISDNQRLVNDVWGDIKADFSFRGPSANNLPVIKPDITAPGLEILAAYKDGDTAANGSAEVDLLQGTSMSSPHVAGLGALMKALHPSWSVSEIKSALMMTAITDNLKKTDMVTPADPFDYGSGRAWISGAANAGMVLSESIANYKAADPSNGGDPRTLNLASMQENLCLGSCSWTRTFKSVADEPVQYVVEAPAWVTVSPANFIIQPGASQTVTIMANALDFEAGTWQYAYVFFKVVPPVKPALPFKFFLPFVSTDPEETPPPLPKTPPAYSDLHLSLAIMPTTSTLTDKMVFETHRDADTGLIPNVQAMAITDLTVNRYGWVKGTKQTINLAKDATRDEVFDDVSQTYYEVLPTQGIDYMRYVVEITSTTASDLDLFWGYDINGNGLPEESEAWGMSATPSALEYISEIMPYPDFNLWFLIQNWGGSAAPTDQITFSYALVPFGPDPGNMTVNAEVNGAPTASIPAGQPFDLRVGWDVPTEPEDRLYGLINVFTDPTYATNLGYTVLDVRVGADDVVKTASPTLAGPGDTVTFNLNITNYYPTEMAYTLSDPIPAGMTYVDGSATGGAVYDPVANAVTWAGTISGPVTPHYEMTTSDDDPDCTGWYLDLAVLGIKANPNISGDEGLWAPAAGDIPFNFFGRDYPAVGFTDDAMLVYDYRTNWVPAESIAPTNLPNPALPNNFMSPLWQDMEVVYDAAANKGVTIATSGKPPVTHIIEYDDVQVKGNPAQTYDLQIWLEHQPDKTSYPEIVFAYNNITGPTTAAKIGVEDPDGATATVFSNGGATIRNGFNICFDWFAPSSSETISFKATVDAGASFPLTNTVNHDNEHPGTRLEAAAVTLERDPANVDVTDEATLRAALANPDVTTINVKNDFPVASSVVLDRPLTFNGGGFTLSFSDGPGSRVIITAESVVNDLKVNAGLTNPAAWNSAYGIQVYNTKATLNNLSASGGNAGLMVNSSDVTLKGTITLSGNGFGGMEVSQSPTLAPARKPSLTGANVTFVNADDASLKPTIWVDKYAADFGSLTPVALTGGTQFTQTTLTTAADGKDQLQYNIVVPVP